MYTRESGTIGARNGYAIQRTDRLLIPGRAKCVVPSLHRQTSDRGSLHKYFAAHRATSNQNNTNGAPRADHPLSISESQVHNNKMERKKKEEFSIWDPLSVQAQHQHARTTGLSRLSFRTSALTTMQNREGVNASKVACHSSTGTASSV